MVYVYNYNLLWAFENRIVKHIAHSCNTKGKMGAGVAKAISQKYPQALQVDREYPISFGKERLGEYSFWEKEFTNNDIGKIVNLYGQLDWQRGEGNGTDYKALETALTSFCDSEMKKNLSTQCDIGLPMYVGAGLGGGDWNIIHNILEKIEYKRKSQIKFWLISLEKP